MVITKRGTFSSAISFVVFIFILCLVLIIVYSLNTEIYNKFNEVLTTSQTSAMANSADVLVLVSNSLPFIMGGMLLVLIIGNYFIRTNPAFAIVSAILMIICFVFIIPIFGNFFESFIGAHESYNASATALTQTVNIMQNYYWVFGLACIVVTIIFLYAKEGNDAHN